MSNKNRKAAPVAPSTLAGRAAELRVFLGKVLDVTPFHRTLVKIAHECAVLEAEMAARKAGAGATRRVVYGPKQRRAKPVKRSAAKPAATRVETKPNTRSLLALMARTPGLSVAKYTHAYNAHRGTSWATKDIRNLLVSLLERRKVITSGSDGRSWSVVKAPTRAAAPRVPAIPPIPPRQGFSVPAGNTGNASASATI